MFGQEGTRATNFGVHIIKWHLLKKMLRSHITKFHSNAGNGKNGGCVVSTSVLSSTAVDWTALINIVCNLGAINQNNSKITLPFSSSTGLPYLPNPNALQILVCRAVLQLIFCNRTLFALLLKVRCTEGCVRIGSVQQFVSYMISAPVRKTRASPRITIRQETRFPKALPRSSHAESNETKIHIESMAVFAFWM